MSIDKSNDDNVQAHTEAYYEESASQEEIYLEEQEERARAVLIAENPSPFGCKQLSIDRELVEAERSMADANSRHVAERAAEELGHATEELITGDSDDPPLSDEAVAKMLKTS